MKRPFLPALLAILIVLSAIIFAKSAFAPFALDITQDRLFSLDKASTEELRKNNEKVDIRLYYSQNAAKNNPEIRNYAMRVRDRLREFANVSGGNLTLHIVSVRQFSKEEDEAIALGLTPYNDNQTTLEPIYLGASFQSATKSAIIPAFNQQNERNLNSEIMNAISSVNAKQKPTIGILSAQNWFVDDQLNGAPKPVAQIAKSLAEQFNLIKIPNDFSNLPNFDLLMIVQPPNLNEIQQNLLDKYMVGGGRAIIALDPYSNISADNQIGEVRYAQNLGKLENAWGIGFANEILLDKDGALPVKAVVGGREIIAPQPAFFNIKPANFETNAPFLKGLEQGINFATPSYFVPQAKDGLTVTPLIKSNLHTMRADEKLVKDMANPQEAENLWEGEDKQQILAQSIKGQFKSAFNNQIGNKEGEIIAFADTDFLADSLYSDDGNAIADNDMVILNAVDYLLGQGVKLRASQTSNRTLTFIQTQKQAAQQAILQKQGELNQDLQTQNQQLQDLIKQKSLLPQDTNIDKSIADAREKILKTRGDLRALNDNVRLASDNAKYWILGICGVFVPFLVLTFGFLRLRNRRKFGVNGNG